MKLVEPKEAAVKKPDKDMFDPKKFLAKVGTGKQVLEFHKNQHVFEQGDVADTVFYIQKGRVKLTVLSEQGKEAVVAILEPGQFFGEGCMHGHPLRIATTTAMENCVITSITKAAMIAAVAWHLGVRLRDFSRRWAFWLETEAGPSLKLAVNVRLDLRIPFRARPRFCGRADCHGSGCGCAGARSSELGRASQSRHLRAAERGARWAGRAFLTLQPSRRTEGE